MNDLVRVATSDRLFARHTGGNTTYATALYDRLPNYGVRHLLLAAPPAIARHRVTHAAWETGFLVRSARANQADVVHFPSDTGPIRKSSDIAIATTIHGVADLYGAGVRRPLAGAIWRKRVGLAAKHSDALITVSNSSARDIAASFDVDLDRIHVIHHGIDHSIFRRLDDDECRRCLEPYRLPSRFGLFVGNIEPRKQVALAAKAFATDRVRSAGIPLVVVGRPAWEGRSILEQIDRLPNNVYLGPLSQDVVVALMNRASLFIFPSRYEGFGFPVLEAMACGCPAVTTGVGALPEIAGDAALFVEPSIDAVADAVVSLALDDGVRHMMRADGLAQASKFTWTAAAQRHAEVFADLASARG